jgi:predicted ABC-type ATPase
MSQQKKVVVVAGPNGAGKSTSAANLLLGALHVNEFVNADVIAQGLSGFAPERVAFQAGRVMLARLRELADAGRSFGFETTLASRSYAPWLRELRGAGFEIHILFLWLPTADQAVARVAERVRAGGHAVPEDVIRRRYSAGLKNLIRLYTSIADSWQIIDNSHLRIRRQVAVGQAHGPSDIEDSAAWQLILDEVEKL